MIREYPNIGKGDDAKNWSDGDGWSYGKWKEGNGWGSGNWGTGDEWGSGWFYGAHLIAPLKFGKWSDYMRWRMRGGGLKIAHQYV